jgi:soluble lytic murein transglycosylase
LLGVAAFVALISVRFPVRHLDTVLFAAELREVEPALVMAVIMAESSFREGAVSRAGAQGLMQLMPATATELAAQLGVNIENVDIFDPLINISLGTQYLAQLIALFDGEIDTALAAYNAGRGNVANWLADYNHSADGRTLHSIPFRETENYLTRVNFNKRVYRVLLRLRGVR